MTDSPSWQAVAFRCGGQLMLAGVSAISEIVDLGKCTQIPGSVEWFRGLGSVRGNVVPVTDLSGFLFGEPSEESEHNRMLLIQQDENIYGLLVEEIFGLRKYSVSQLSSDTSDLSDQIKPFVVETVHDAERVFPVLDPAQLISDETFLTIKCTRDDYSPYGNAT